MPKIIPVTAQCRASTMRIARQSMLAKGKENVCLFFTRIGHVPESASCFYGFCGKIPACQQSSLCLHGPLAMRRKMSLSEWRKEGRPRTAGALAGGCFCPPWHGCPVCNATEQWPRGQSGRRGDGADCLCHQVNDTIRGDGAGSVRQRTLGTKRLCLHLEMRWEAPVYCNFSIHR